MGGLPPATERAAIGVLASLKDRPVFSRSLYRRALRRERYPERHDWAEGNGDDREPTSSVIPINIGLSS